MVSLLESQFKARIAKAFKGKLLRGTFRRSVESTQDSFGDLATPTVTSFSFEGIRESFSARYKAQSGIPESDVSILILVGSVKPPTVFTEADQDQMVFMSTPWNEWYKIRRVLEIDPAGASVRLQCYEVPAP